MFACVVCTLAFGPLKFKFTGLVAPRLLGQRSGSWHQRNIQGGRVYIYMPSRLPPIPSLTAINRQEDCCVACTRSLCECEHGTWKNKGIWPELATHLVSKARGKGLIRCGAEGLMVLRMFCVSSGLISLFRLEEVQSCTYWKHLILNLAASVTQVLHISRTKYFVSTAKTLAQWKWYF